MEGGWGVLTIRCWVESDKTKVDPSLQAILLMAVGVDMSTPFLSRLKEMDLTVVGMAQSIQSAHATGAAADDRNSLAATRHGGSAKTASAVSQRDCQRGSKPRPSQVKDRVNRRCHPWRQGRFTQCMVNAIED